MGRCPNGRAAGQRRPAAAGNRDQAAPRPRRRSRRDTQALSQAIRIATWATSTRTARNSRCPTGRSRSASRSTRMRAALSTIRICRCRPSTGGSVPLKVGRRHRLRRRPDHGSSATTRCAGIVVGADLAPGVVSGDAWKRSTQLPTMKNLPQGVQIVPSARSKWQAEMINNFIIAVIARHLAGLRGAGAALPAGSCRRFVNMGSLLLAPLGGLLALRSGRHADLDAGLYRPADAARHRRQELDPADRLRDRGNGQGRAQARGDHRRRPQARPADRDDHGGDDRRHGPDRAVAVGRRRLARADGHHRDRRPDPVDDAHAGDRPGRRSAWPTASRSGSARGCAAGSTTGGKERPAARRRSRRSEPRRRGSSRAVPAIRPA